MFTFVYHYEILTARVALEGGPPVRSPMLRHVPERPELLLPETEAALRDAPGIVSPHPGLWAVTPFTNAYVPTPPAPIGIRAPFKVPLVILLAFKLGILDVLNVPPVILLAFKFGIRLVENVPLDISDAE